MMKKVLLTGATGVVGRQVIPLLLDRRYEVHAVCHKTRSSLPYCNQDGVWWHQCNLLDHHAQKVLLAEVYPTHLLHLAWYTEHGKFWDAKENIEWVQASLALLLYFREVMGQRAVFCGSCAEYDWHYGFCSETSTPKRPVSLYGCCKNSLQEIVRCFSTANHISSAWARIFFFYGPYEYPGRLVASVITALLQKTAVPCSHGNQIRDFLYVKDVAEALAALLDCDVQGPVNIASGQPRSLREIVCAIGEQLGASDQIKFGELSTAQEAPVVLADVRRLRQEVNWQPRYTLEAGLAETISWWKQQLISKGMEKNL
ncbi:hypothetical protein P22_1159 [Propionispora sp. 2/2-37]|uniref:NAD-dependent epimerase/dehydratase family protein n=1 Tax=Propionispora sp. 2/2-37 TaxID=1677858 RepID=UPI0006C49458|nr:NAD(P)-dependent oxidoreductase [Propionispora sp. 2/2-37]CUH95090.1 hypothetical protein P22_1159 [Propionispora sp. 2/2-37]